MAEDESSKTTLRSMETQQGAQETQVEHRFPFVPAAAGVVPLPRGSKGARSLYLRRVDNSFGFTLRHFIVYPPDSVVEQDEQGGSLSTPIDTIFVKNIKEGGPAEKAGLQRGDRILAVNNTNVCNCTYKKVVQLIGGSPDYLHLLVGSREDDILQKVFANAAHNPASNQVTVKSSQRLIKSQHQQPSEFQVDAISWRSLQYPYDHQDLQLYGKINPQRNSADSLLNPASNDLHFCNPIYAEIQPNDLHVVQQRAKSRAQPQVPLYRKMGRRASGGCLTGESITMKAIYNKPSYLPEGTQDAQPSYPNCRLSMDASRRESSASLSSSLADGSKDSLSSYDSTYTLTGHETDDSAILTRLKKNVQRKEEFLRMPVEPIIVQREFYGQPKKLEKTQWPPERQESPPRQPAHKPTHHHFTRVKNDIDCERDMLNNPPPNVQSGGVAPLQPHIIVKVQSPNDKKYAAQMGRIYEASTPPQGFDQNLGPHPTALADEKRMYPPMQNVHRRAKEFESGRPLPDEDLIMTNRTNFSRSELARLSSKRLVPNVTERAQEYEVRTVEPARRDTSSTSINSSILKRFQRDSRSLDSSGSTASSSSVNEVLQQQKNQLQLSPSDPDGTNRLSGNVTISSGSKFIHCPPPSLTNTSGKTTAESTSEDAKGRARSNSAESWVTAIRDSRHTRPSRPDERIKGIKPITGTPPALDRDTLYGDLPPLIPESVERFQRPPELLITPATPNICPPVAPARAIRPTQLDLESPIRPSRRLKPPTKDVDTPMRQSFSPVPVEEKSLVVRRRNKNTKIADDERAMRRESYLKATEGGRMHIDSDLSDDGSPQVQRSAHHRLWRLPIIDIEPLRRLYEDGASSLGGSLSGNSSSSASLEREKLNASPLLEQPKEKEELGVVREGGVHCKISEIDGKRSSDRSWYKIWMVLKGPKLFLYKDRHHQSPIGTSDALDQSLSSGVDLRTSVVRVAEDYTKRKNVLRVSAVKPCRSEFLLQADSTEEFADWFKTLQQQVAASTEAELDPAISKQQAVPQLVPAATTIQVQGSHLSPQLNKPKTNSSRNRSPTGQSPVSKSRKPSQLPEPATSPKSKTWRGRMAKQFRKIQGSSSPSSPTAPEAVSTFGIPLDQCLPSHSNAFVPRFVEFCTNIVDERGLKVVGIYRVPGNNASITALTEEINRTFDDVPQEDARWNDLHVVSSLLKSFLRKLPDSLVTVALYPKFIEADKIGDPRLRLEELRRLVKNLPSHNYHTLKHVIRHLCRVVENSESNRMEAKNLAIVFGPTIIKQHTNDMESFVTDMNNICKIMETLISFADWFFSDNEAEDIPLPQAATNGNEELEHVVNQTLLIDNISKIEALKDPKEKNGALLSSIKSAAARVKKRATKPANTGDSSKATSPTTTKIFLPTNYASNDLKENITCTDGIKSSNTHSTVTTIDQQPVQQPPASNASPEKVPWFNYSNQDQIRQRIEHFKQETEAMLHLPRKMEIPFRNVRDDQLPSDYLTKTLSASNIRSSSTQNKEVKTALGGYSRNSLNSPYSVQYTDNPLCLNNIGLKNNGNTLENNQKIGRRVNSIENINTGPLDINANTGGGGLKKIKYNQNNVVDAESLSSLTMTDEEPDLTTAMTNIFNQKLKETNILSGENLPFADESPEKMSSENFFHMDKENKSRENDLYKNPSLHKTSSSKLVGKYDSTDKECNVKDVEKDEDTTSSQQVPDNDRLMIRLPRMSSKLTTTLLSPNSSKLRRSESLNKPDRTVSPHYKLKRSESLNKQSTTEPYRLKRSDSLTKKEKTENNINRRHELTNPCNNNRRSKEQSKNKRKNGLSDRSIKRRHTVGGTKDPDKVTWLDNKYQQEFTSTKENIKEKNLRTSSPDLSSTRRERLYEISLIGPENIVVALREHFIGNRPQSFPEAFKLPLESHV